MTHEDWPRDIHGRRICTKERPMPADAPKGSAWAHTRIEATNNASAYTNSYHCTHCGARWTSEVSE